MKKWNFKDCRVISGCNNKYFTNKIDCITYISY